MGRFKYAFNIYYLVVTIWKRLMTDFERNLQKTIIEIMNGAERFEKMNSNLAILFYFIFTSPPALFIQSVTSSRRTMAFLPNVYFPLPIQLISREKSMVRIPADESMDVWFPSRSTRTNTRQKWSPPYLLFWMEKKDKQRLMVGPVTPPHAKPDFIFMILMLEKPAPFPQGNRVLGNNFFILS